PVLPSTTLSCPAGPADDPHSTGRSGPTTARCSRSRRRPGSNRRAKTPGRPPRPACPRSCTLLRRTPSPRRPPGHPRCPPRDSAAAVPAAPVEEPAQPLPRGAVPRPGRVVHASGDQEFAVGRDRQVRDVPGVALQPPDFLPGGAVPDGDRRWGVLVARVGGD